MSTEKESNVYFSRVKSKIIPFQEMKSLETKEAKGCRFVVADDLRSAASWKSEGQRKNIFTILRHFQRIKEIRGPGQILRYAIL